MQYQDIKTADDNPMPKKKISTVSDKWVKCEMYYAKYNTLIFSLVHYPIQEKKKYKIWSSLFLHKRRQSKNISNSCMFYVTII